MAGHVQRKSEEVFLLAPEKCNRLMEILYSPQFSRAAGGREYRWDQTSGNIHRVIGRQRQPVGTVSSAGDRMRITARDRHLLEDLRNLLSVRVIVIDHKTEKALSEKGFRFVENEFGPVYRKGPDISHYVDRNGVRVPVYPEVLAGAATREKGGDMVIAPFNEQSRDALKNAISLTLTPRRKRDAAASR